MLEINKIIAGVAFLSVVGCDQALQRNNAEDFGDKEDEEVPFRKSKRLPLHPEQPIPIEEFVYPEEPIPIEPAKEEIFSMFNDYVDYRWSTFKGNDKLSVQSSDGADQRIFIFHIFS